MSSDQQATKISSVDAQVVNLAVVKAEGALSPTGRAHVMDAWLQFDPHDAYVTSPSVLGVEAGALFLEAIANPGPQLTDAPIAIQD